MNSKYTFLCKQSKLPPEELKSRLDTLVELQNEIWELRKDGNTLQLVGAATHSLELLRMLMLRMLLLCGCCAINHAVQLLCSCCAVAVAIAVAVAVAVQLLCAVAVCCAVAVLRCRCAVAVLFLRCRCAVAVAVL